MKIFKKTGIILAGIAAIGTVSSCKKLLVEEPRAALYPSYFTTPAGIAAGIAGVYSAQRGRWGGEANNRQWIGTDEARQGTNGSSNDLQADNFNGINSSNSLGMDGNWANINTLNGVLKFADEATGLSATDKAAYVAQAKFLRGWLYFDLVQKFGGTTATEKSGIPLHLDFITEATTADAPAPMADIYNSIIKDLTDAAAGLPNTVTSTNPFSNGGIGKPATAAVAKNLLAKVYLTRGYLTEIAVAGDFQKAADLTAEIIANKASYGLDLWQSFADAHKVENDYGKENMFNIDFGLGGADESFTGYTQQGDGGWGINFLYVIWRFNYISDAGIDNNNTGIDAVPQSVNTAKQPMRRDNYNGRPYARVAPNGPYLYTIFPPGQIKDSRFDATFQTFWIANKNTAPGLNSLGVPKGALIPTSNFSETTYNVPVDGDTAILIAPGDVTMARRDAFKGLIIEPAQISGVRWPTVKKFDDTRRTRLNDKSARPVVIMRFSEVYLINAEANYMLGNTAAAATSLNVLRTRAGYRNPADGARVPAHSFKVTAANMAAANAANIAAMQLSPTELAQLAIPYNKSSVAPFVQNGLDLILDEYSRELFGDPRRWEDLVRTRYLVRRVKMYKAQAAPQSITNIQEYHMRRPIPQSLINAVLTGPPYPQNNGY